VLSDDLKTAVKQWFRTYLLWLTTHPYGADEKNNGNNHSTCWVMQVSAFASLTGDQALLADCRRFFKETLLPSQMAVDGSFPRELKRTKPYGYSLFNLDAMATVCHLLSVPGDDLWEFATPDGRDMRRAVGVSLPLHQGQESVALPA
jgi:hypothetical protein